MRSIYAILLAATALIGWVECDGDYGSGRATFYGGQGDGASINSGSCEYHDLSYGNNGQGYFVTALSDTDPDFNGGCGRCYEVACRNGEIRDGYGNVMKRQSACHDESKSVFVKVTDSCPCYYPANAYSNRRWCCGDNGVRHMDLSYLAFQQLAPLSMGVIGLRFRAVPCTLWSAADGTAKPIDPNSPHNASSASMSSSEGGQVLAFSGPSEDSASNGPASSPSDSSSSSSAQSVVVSGKVQPGWYASHWNLQGEPWVGSGNSLCAQVQLSGALAFGRSGSKGLGGVNAVTYRLAWGVSDVELLVMGDGGLASTPAKVSGTSGTYALPGNADLGRLSSYSKVVIRNKGSGTQQICVSDLQLS